MPDEVWVWNRHMPTSCNFKLICWMCRWLWRCESWNSLEDGVKFCVYWHRDRLLPHSELHRVHVCTSSFALPGELIDPRMFIFRIFQSAGRWSNTTNLTTASETRKTSCDDPVIPLNHRFYLHCSDMFFFLSLSVFFFSWNSHKRNVKQLATN